MNTSYTEEENTFLKQLGNRIRELRISQSISQERLAFICDLDRTYIGSVERGERNVSVLNLKKLSLSLDVSLSQFFEE
ncbi:MAG: helix-turn-helix domain-containing protein [Rudanella sp.]|nr:helix-turn-helix domain-containing protein [Rudanella sp.]